MRTSQQPPALELPQRALKTKTDRRDGALPLTPFY